MFILRTLTDHDSEANTHLGKNYQIVYATHKEFKQIISDHGLKGGIKALVFDQDRDIHPVYTASLADYIMTDSGRTFFKFRNSI